MFITCTLSVCVAFVNWRRDTKEDCEAVKCEHDNDFLCSYDAGTKLDIPEGVMQNISENAASSQNCQINVCLVQAKL